MDILVAAEEAESLRFYKLLLEDWGYSIVISQDGDECLDVYRKKLRSKKRFDLVILDYRLPKKNGMEVAKDMMTLVPKQKILMLTTYEGLIDPKEKPDNLKTIEKPFGVQELQVMIRAHYVLMSDAIRSLQMLRMLGGSMNRKNTRVYPISSRSSELIAITVKLAYLIRAQWR